MSSDQELSIIKSDSFRHFRIAYIRADKATHGQLNDETIQSMLINFGLSEQYSVLSIRSQMRLYIASISREGKALD